MPQTTIIRCKKCGMPLVAGTKICSYCGGNAGGGKSIKKTTQTSVSAPQSKAGSIVEKILGSTGIPWVSLVILLLNTGCGIYEIIRGSRIVISQWGMYQGALAAGEWYRIFLSEFIHVNGEHFASNMIGLAMYGFLLENHIGRIKYALVYFFSMIGAGLVINFFGGEMAIHSGASGALCGIAAAALVYYLKNHRIVMSLMSLRGIVLNLVYTIGTNISWQGHWGGSIAGALLALLIVKGNASENTDKAR